MSLEQTICHIFTERRLTLSTAESCTGGLLAGAITAIQGSSAFFKGGVTTYANEAKEHVLGVSPDIIGKYGAVSAETAMAMADNGRRLFKTDYAVSTTGIAGPTGGTAEKPVGLVYIGVAGPNLCECRKFIFALDRDGNREQAVHEALQFLSETL